MSVQAHPRPKHGPPLDAGDGQRLGQHDARHGRAAALPPRNCGALVSRDQALQVGEALVVTELSDLRGGGLYPTLAEGIRSLAVDHIDGDAHVVNVVVMAIREDQRAKPVQQRPDHERSRARRRQCLGGTHVVGGDEAAAQAVGHAPPLLGRVVLQRKPVALGEPQLVRLGRLEGIQSDDGLGRRRLCCKQGRLRAQLSAAAVVVFETRDDRLLHAELLEGQAQRVQRTRRQGPETLFRDIRVDWYRFIVCHRSRAILCGRGFSDGMFAAFLSSRAIRAASNRNVSRASRQVIDVAHAEVPVVRGRCHCVLIRWRVRGTDAVAIAWRRRGHP
eukprot:m.73041 g.73041  ORF g.73041 m.73041 type:complete len:332 (+) comp7702_c0_seq1:56-1051(+)